jgi:(S)-mandelate dehydrogenase
VPILIDSGYRRGTDIVKALALGANAVLLGRASLYGLAAAGEAGVDHVLQLLKDEVDRTLAQIGCPSVSLLSPNYVMANGSAYDRAATPGRDRHDDGADAAHYCAGYARHSDYPHPGNGNRWCPGVEFVVHA